MKQTSIEKLIVTQPIK